MTALHRAAALLLACLLMSGVMSGAHAQTASQQLQRLFADEWERSLRDSPELASYQGDTRYDDRWSDLAPEAIAARRAAERAALARLDAIDRSALTETERLHAESFAWLLRSAVDRQRFAEELQPLSHQGGVQTADGISEVMPFASVADYRRWQARLDALPRLVEQTIALMRRGIAEGSMPPRVLMQRVPAQIAAQVVDDPERSPYWRPYARFPAAMTDAERKPLRAAARASISDRIVPAYRRLAAFFDAEYLPRTRASVAASDGPGGRAYYDFLIRDYTTTDLDADAIHAIGLAEVARLRAAMDAVKAETGFGGDMPAFFDHLRRDPRFFKTTPAALLDAYRAVAKRIDPELTKVFRTLPRMPYGVRPIPDNIAPDSTTAYYQGGAFDGTRPGYYYVNLYKPDVRPTWEMLPLTLHEAVPGHHLQFARSLELPQLPLVLRTAYFVAYAEGWALYAETLGHEMGLYGDPYDRFGQLAYEMWRAVRLVVDTGIHARGWSRERAIDYFRANCPKTDQDIVNEIDRYIATPGQALAYKIGQLRIAALRQRAARALGPVFDLRDFHDAVLATGSVPLPALEHGIERWIAAQRSLQQPQQQQPRP